MKKGRFYWGPVGVGKTTRLKADFEAFESNNKRLINARKVSLVAQADGLLGVQTIACGNLNMFIDDIGHEAHSVNHFGTMISPLSELIQARYEQHQDWGLSEMTTHFTSNLSPEELRAVYGEYIFDRLVEMCEWVHMDGQSFRK